MLMTTAPNLSHGTGADTAGGSGDEVAGATPENAGKRGGETPNKYKQEVNNLLDAYEQKQARLAREKEAASKQEAEPEGLRDGESWDSVYASQPPEVQRAMAEMRKMMTRKTQELAQERKALEAQRRSLADSGLLQSLSEQAGKMPEEFDPFNAEHIQQAIEAKVAQRLKEVLEPLNQQSQHREAVNRFEGFKAEHPDLLNDPEIKAGVAAALQADEGLSLEAAYWMVKGKKLAAKQALDSEKAAIQKRAMQRAALMTDKGVKPGTPVLSPNLKSQSAWDIYETLKKAKA